jgi:hypothetical protein
MKRAYKPLAVVLLVVALAAPAALAQKPAAAASGATPKYDLATETTLKGTVQEIKEVTTKGAPAMHLMLKTSDQVIEVYLCPNAFLQEVQFGFAVGDQVEVKGSKVKVDDTDVILAREVVKGNETLTLRDKRGNPAWGPPRRG